MENVCLQRSWFEMVARHEELVNGQLRFLGLESGDLSRTPRALLIGRHRERDRLAFGGRSFTSLDNFYTLLYAPLLATATSSTDRPAASLGPLIAQLSSRTPSYDAIRLQALVPCTPAFATLAQGLSDNKFAVQTYRHFGNWYEPVAGVSYRDYLCARPAQLRNTIARKTRRLNRCGKLDFTVGLGATNSDSNWADYEIVYAASWKAPEPLPGLIRDFADLLAKAGALRLGVMRLDGTPIAAQLWFVWDGVATVYKLAHDRRFDTVSPGTVLTALMIERLLDTERARELDFGPGDEAYKRLWTSHVRERWGILAFNPRTVSGTLGIARHIWGRAAKQTVGRWPIFNSTNWIS